MDAATAQSPPPSASDAPAMATTTTTTKDPTPLASAAASLHSNSHSSIPLTPRSATSRGPGFIPLVTVVGFHHARGPEVESWFGAPEGTDPAADYDWSLLPFMALSDGAHASSEDFSYFTLLRPASEDVPATSLFGISCTRQLDSTQLLNRPADVTRSTVQKAVVVIADSPQYFGMMRERLSVVTQAWFAQREFTDTEILRRFQESLAEEKERGLMQEEEDKDQYLGMSLRELVREFRWQTLVLLKCCLLQPKMLFFGSRCERLCMMQFSLISLIPGLIRNLQDCADPEMNDYEQRLVTPTTLKTSDRNSLLTYMGLPLQIFAKGSLFGPYTPLQQLDILADFGTKSYIVGSTNSLLLQQKDRYSDILINLDDNSVNITSTSLRQALTLSAADRRWIDYLTQEVNETWDETNPGRPKTMGYVGSEEFIRLQFEEYILSLISSFKYHKHLQANQGNPRALLPHIEYDPVLDFGTDFVDYWTRTENHRMWNSHTDSHLFDVVDPKHPCAGGLTIDDVQRRIAQQVQDMHLDERFAQGREVLGRNFAAGRDKASTMFNKFYADLETYREAQRQKAKETQSAATSPTLGGPEKSDAQQGQQAASTKAGAYVGSWVSWAGEKRKGWGAGWGKKSDKSGASSPGPLSPREANPGEKEGRFSGGSFWARTSSSKDDHGKANGSHEEKRPMTGASFSESIISAAGTTDEASGSPKRGRRPLSGESVELQVEAPESPVKVEAASPAQVDGPVSPVKVEAPVSLVKVEERPASPIEVKDTPATPAKVETPTSPVKPTSAPVEEESEEDSKATAVKADDSTTEEAVKQTEVTVQDTALPAATALPMSPTEESKAT
ncbi:cytoplasm protein [Plectosphaerella cucumerina]|uniref:Cytoplasm protein n=1 Tax=Plectosphaerella cucumerina TaxID=40658 RepID=A0A8K0TP47_9PEZI|nr:cytoplasm protein [Plectosphaerella cucumerina]